MTIVPFSNLQFGKCHPLTVSTSGHEQKLMVTTTYIPLLNIKLILLMVLSVIERQIIYSYNIHIKDVLVDAHSSFFSSFSCHIIQKLKDFRLVM